jgi:hypothetical protein
VNSKTTLSFPSGSGWRVRDSWNVSCGCVDGLLDATRAVERTARKWESLIIVVAVVAVVDKMNE